LAISNWELDSDKIVFRGRSSNVFLHHTIVKFCDVIQDEIIKTKSVFDNDARLFDISDRVMADIETSGYRYIPYTFSLDESRVYELLMGRNIYNNRLDCLRELIQNSVDACRLRDAMLLMEDKSLLPTKANRISIRYEELPNSVILSVIDSGTGMDRYLIENYFLKKRPIVLFLWRVF
jgi:signal transduction histidine kinase